MSQAAGPDGIAIREATREDAARLAALGARLFAETYGPTHPDPELSRYLATAFAVETVAAALRRPDTRLLLAEDAAGHPAGYAWLQAVAPSDPALRLEGKALEVQRFYVAREWQGHGVAQALMAGCREEAARRGADYLWLQVWQQAPWAIRFYEKSGFRIAGTTTFAWGDQLDIDWVMVGPAGGSER